MKTFKKPENWNELLFYQKIKYFGENIDETYSPYVNKIKAKEIVKNILGDNIFIPKVIKIYENLKQIKKSDINNNLILKVNNSSGANLDCQKINNFISFSNFILFYHNLEKKKQLKLQNENQYKYINKKYFLEEKIDDFYYGKTEKAVVFMFRCFYGKVHTIGVKSGNENTLYDINWNILESSNFLIDKPLVLDKMIENAEKLSSEFEFVRIDFYLSKNNEIYFSEYTFTPNGGAKTFDNKIEKEMSKLWY
jgi:hypothetical protein